MGLRTWDGGPRTYKWERRSRTGIARHHMKPSRWKLIKRIYPLPSSRIDDSRIIFIDCNVVGCSHRASTAKNDKEGYKKINEGRSGGLVCIVGSFEFSCELAKRLNMGYVEEHIYKKVYYWRIYSRKNIESFYNFVYQHPDLGLQRKKRKIEEILRSYRRG